MRGNAYAVREEMRYTLYNRFPAKKGQLQWCSRLLPESHDHDLVLTVLYMPTLLEIGELQEPDYLYFSASGSVGVSRERITSMSAIVPKYSSSPLFVGVTRTSSPGVFPFESLELCIEK